MKLVVWNAKVILIIVQNVIVKVDFCSFNFNVYLDNALQDMKGLAKKEIFALEKEFNVTMAMILISMVNVS